ncbi:hypothetical protein B0T11DRAFT_313350 [Plectosphaerella cucumerina]|uniref:F-box domain-containing protein n=1 Tax=Plectosphaerella cucumerina TaxID=40658 RepID=A0A8K0TMI9_9PEZI|nr:hypothetical protein B0T11DRAFT_313350 [Plectosphaerella cucumerina]
MDAVLSTPELLESILLAVDAATLLTRCQLVCRGWKEAIQTSPSLQHHLFFLSEPSSRSSGPPRKNGLLESKFGFMFGNHLDDGVVSRASFEDLALAKSREAFARPDATWRRMYISQPAIQKLSVLSVRHARGGTSYTAEKLPRTSQEGDVEDESDQTAWKMADLYDYVLQYMFQNRVAYLRVWWGVLPKEGIGLSGQEHGIRGEQKEKVREDLEKLFYDNNQVVVVRKMTVQCVKGVRKDDLDFRDKFSLS